PWTIPLGWERGTATARLIEPDNGRTITLAASGWSPSTHGKVVGDVVVLNARNAKDLEKYKGKLKNAIVLQSRPADVRPITDLNSNVPGQDRRGRGGPGAPGQGTPGQGAPGQGSPGRGAGAAPV